VIHRKAFAVVILAAGLSSGPARAIDPEKSLGECSVDSWRSRDGVPGWVRALAQTPEGYLWIGTNAGLARYGGGKVEPVASPPTAAAPASAIDVMALLAARDGTLWITPSRGDPICARAGVVQDCFPAGQHLAAGAHIIDLQQDAHGAIWIATAEGIYQFAAGHLGLRHAAVALPFDRPLALLPDRKGRLWVGAASGLFHVRGSSVERYPAAAAADLGAVSSFFETPGGRIWVAAERGLLRIEGEEASFFGAAAGFASGRPTQVIEDRDGNVWFGGRRGLTRFRPGQGFVRFTRQDGLPEDDVTCVFEDREGSLWVGTRGWGIAQFTDRTLDGRAGPPSLQDRWINSLAEDPAGSLWVGTRSGLTRWRRDQHQERTWGKADGLPSDNVLSVQPTPTGAIWVGTEAGLARWRDGKIDLPVPFAAAVTALYLDHAGVLWIGTSDGVAKLQTSEPSAAAPPVVQRLSLEPGLQLNEIRGMQHDDRGVLWLSAGGKLFNVDPATDTVVTPTSVDPAIGKIRSLFRDEQGVLYLGSADGLVLNQAGGWTRFTGAQGLVSADLFQVVTDDRGSVWASTTAGIVRVAKSSLAEVAAGRRARVDIVAFPASDQRREVGAVRARQPGAWRGRDGRLWFATSRGVVSLDPARLRVNTVPPVVLVEKYLVDGRPADRAGRQAFPPGAGALEFHFSSITLIEPQKANHRYRLEGFDQDWIEAGTRRAAYYTNIPPGQYRFRVQGSNADGVWNQTGDVVALTLAPHYYQTWWFYALCAAAALGLGFSFNRMHVAQVHSRYAATFSERNRVARELHDSLLQGMAAALLHMKGLRKRFGPTAPPPKPDAVAGALERIESLIGLNMEETRRFVWDLRERPIGGGPVLVPALEQLVRQVREGTAVEVKLRVDNGAALLSLPQHPQRELLRITQEALTNAIKHAQAAHIEVSLSSRDHQAIVAVVDDGRGFDPAQAPGADAGHFGLVGMRERAAGIGTLIIESQPGQGTRVEVTIDRKFP
jgi:signal transduction histidine kinase/ligand-binding sensor domain-containing protein